MILITSSGELLLYFTVIFFSFQKKKKKTVLQDLCCFYVALFLPLLQESIPRIFAAGIHSQRIRNLEGRLLKVNLPQELGLNLN